MANSEHVERLTDYVADWNKWREANPEVVPDLSGADLSNGRLFHKNLVGANLTRANLTRAHACKVDFSQASAQGLIAEDAHFDECNFDDCELSNKASFRADTTPNQLLIDAYTARLARLMPVPRERCASFRNAKFYRTSLRRAILDMADLSNVSLFDCCFASASLIGAKLYPAFIDDTSFEHADFAEADLAGANLSGADLTGANLPNAVMIDANLGPKRVVHMRNLTVGGGGPSTVESFEHPEWATKLRGANLQGADLRNACLVQADLRDADLRGARVYGISAWNVNLIGAKQENLIVTHPSEPALVVEGLELAQFMHLMLKNESLRQVIDTITSKVVLVLGNFAAEWMPILDTIRRGLRSEGYVPVLCDFEKPRSRTLTETVNLLGRMARFVVAEVSEPRCVPHEIHGLAQTTPYLPIVPLCQRGYTPYAMLNDYPTVMSVVEYDDVADVSTRLRDTVIAAAETRLAQLTVGRTRPGAPQAVQASRGHSG